MEGEAAAGGDVAGEELWDRSVVILRISQSMGSQQKDGGHPIRGSYGVVCHQANKKASRTIERLPSPELQENMIGKIRCRATAGGGFEGLRAGGYREVVRHCTALKLVRRRSRTEW